MHIHIDPLGGMAGDMFVAALLHAFPEHEPGVLASVRAASRQAPVACRTARHNDGVLDGLRFVVDAPAAGGSTTQVHRHSHGHVHAEGPAHSHSQAHSHVAIDAHRPWADIRRDLRDADLDDAVRDGALAIFTRLAAAEARVHGIAIDQVAFHEVGAWDSIADVVAAAHLVAAIGATSWHVGPLPLGAGRVMSAHGPLPVPAPATTLLLQGFATLDDGIPGERVTPTGAAILGHLCETSAPAPRPRKLGRTGIGFGTKVLPGLSNCVRIICYDDIEATTVAGHRELGVIEFEVDDQSAEDLAMGLDGLRAHPDVFDVVQMPVFGKKGRMMTHVRALARATAIEAAIEACFRETTTIGLRHHVVSGAALPRAASTVEVNGRPVRVKIVERPGGRTAKAEADDALPHDGHAARAALRREAERRALRRDAE